MPISPIWPAATAVDANGAIAFHGRTAESLLDEFGSPLYLIDADEVSARAKHFVRAAAEAFNTSTTHVSFAGKAFLSKEIVRLVAEAGMFVDTCTMGEMRIALAAGVPGLQLRPIPFPGSVHSAMHRLRLLKVPLFLSEYKLRQI